MSLLEGFDRFNRRLSFGLEWIGLAGLLAMMLITCIDVAGAKIFKWPLHGALDLVMIAQLFAVAFAVASGLALGRHVEVEFFVPLLPKTLQRIVAAVVHLICLALFVVICWRLFSYGHFLQIGRDVTPTLRLPLYGFAYAAAAGLVPVCLIYLHRFLLSLLRIAKK
jgi:TRAP-type C4-dicarboxylate transport system permease small subunit